MNSSAHAISVASSKNEYDHTFAYADAFRAIAIIGVIFFHTMPTLRFGHLQFIVEDFGNIFVNTFFILSGYLLSRPFFRAILTHSKFPNVLSFLHKRALRIYPAYVVAVVASIPLASSNITQIHFVLTHLTFIYGFLPEEILAKNVPLWTMAVDAQFYIALPILSYAVYVYTAKLSEISREKTIYLLLFALMGFSLIWRSIAESHLPTGVSQDEYYASRTMLLRNLIGLSGSFALGGLLALREVTGKSISTIRAKYLLAIGVVLFVTILPAYTQYVNFPWKQDSHDFMAAIPITLIFAALSTGVSTSLNKLVRSYVIRKIAELSYSMYLIHWICLVFSKKYLFPLSIGFHVPLSIVQIGSMAALSISFAWVINKYIERPFLRLKNQVK